MRRERFENHGNLFDADGVSVVGSSSAPSVPGGSGDSGQLRLDDDAAVPILLRRAWDRALRMLSQRVNKPTFETHLRGLKPLAFTEEINDRQQIVRRVTVGAPSAFTRSWVEGRHAPLIREVLEEVFDGQVVLNFALIPKETQTDNRTVPLVADNTGRNVALPLENSTDAQSHVPASASPLRSSNTGSRGTVETTPAVPERRTAQAVIPVGSCMEARSASPAVVSIERHPDAPEINPRYTFDRFVVGPTNRLAHGGARAVAESPGQRYNPLFLYGPPGLGKTHLLHAIVNAQIHKPSNDRPRIAYMSGEAFTAQYVMSLRQHKTEEFRRKLKAVDLLLVDDIQFIAGKEQTKEEFFHVFNTLAQTGKQIVICSDRSPRDLTAMDERLQSRFESGLVADVTSPDLELRLAILQKKAENESTRVPDDVLLYMARLVQSNIRTLEGALVKLVAYASLMNSPVTTQMAEGILERYFIAAGAGLDNSTLGGKFGEQPSRPRTTTASFSIRNDRQGSVEMPSVRPSPSVMIPSKAVTPSQKPNETGRPVDAGLPPSFVSTSDAGRGVERLTPELIQRVVAARFGVAPDDMYGKRRDRDATNARQVAMHLLRELTDMSLPGIGQLFGGRDHTTVIHACDRVRAQIGIDDDLKAVLSAIMAEMGNPVPKREKRPPQRHSGQTFENGFVYEP